MRLCGREELILARLSSYGTKYRARYTPRRTAKNAIPCKEDIVPPKNPPSAPPSITNAAAESVKAHTRALCEPCRKCADATGVSTTVTICDNAYMRNTP